MDRITNANKINFSIAQNLIRYIFNNQMTKKWSNFSKILKTQCYSEYVLNDGKVIIWWNHTLITLSSFSTIVVFVLLTIKKIKHLPNVFHFVSANCVNETASLVIFRRKKCLPNARQSFCLEYYIFYVCVVLCGFQCSIFYCKI